MGLIIFCHERGYTLYEDEKMIILYKLRNKIYNRCPGYKRRLSMKSSSIEIDNKELND